MEKTSDVITRLVLEAINSRKGCDLRQIIQDEESYRDLQQEIKDIVERNI